MNSLWHIGFNTKRRTTQAEPEKVISLDPFSLWFQKIPFWPCGQSPPLTHHGPAADSSQAIYWWNNKDIEDVSISTLSTSNNTQHRANAKFTTKITSAWQANVYNLESSTSTEISHRVKTDNNVNVKSNQNNLFQNSIALQQCITDE